MKTSTRRLQLDFEEKIPICVYIHTQAYTLPHFVRLKDSFDGETQHTGITKVKGRGRPYSEKAARQGHTGGCA